MLRVYNNGYNSKRVKYEHAVLQSLYQKTFSFQIPQTIPSLKDKQAFAALPNGAEACVFKCIPGTGPKLTKARAVGRATAELVNGMAEVKIDLPCPNPLYRNLYEAHHKLTKSEFYDAAKSDVFTVKTFL